MTKENDWDWWQRKLAGEPVEMNPDTPHAGFYRKPHKEEYGARKTFTPVAYWWAQPEDDDGNPIGPWELRCRIGDMDVTPQRGQELWTMVGNHPVTEEAYRGVAEDGGLWPDEHELVPMGGDNIAPEDLSFEGLRDKIEDLAREAKERIEGPPIKDQDEADRVANLADRLAELCKIAEEQRKEEKRPYDEGMKAVQKKWAPLLVLAETYKNLKYKLLTPWQLKKDEEARAAADLAAAAGQPEEPRRSRAGTRGRAMTLKTFKRAEIVDYPACLKFFEDSDDVKATVQDLANRAVRAGANVPGTKVIEEQRTV
jgi:hypothetical protein